MSRPAPASTTTDDAAPDTTSERTRDLRELDNHHSAREVYRACHVYVIGHE